MCTRYAIINRVSELKVHIELTRFVQPEKIEIDANERAVNEKSPYCFFVCTTFDSFLNDLYGKNGEEMSIKDGGFSQVDLLQDVDAYNISRLYNLAETKLYAAFEDYYNVSKHYKRRYHIFKQQLLKEFDADSIYAVAFRFAKQEIPILSGLFGLAFGKFNEEYIEIVAHAFEDKIETQISIEEYTA